MNVCWQKKYRKNKQENNVRNEMDFRNEVENL